MEEEKQSKLVFTFILVEGEFVSIPEGYTLIKTEVLLALQEIINEMSKSCCG